MNILVIGNGFDLEHKLPTKYWDFINFYRLISTINMGKACPDYYRAVIDSAMRRLCNSRKKTSISLTEDLQEKLKHYAKSEEICNVTKRPPIIKELMYLTNELNKWFSYFAYSTAHDKVKWSDLENEILNILEYIDYAGKVLDKSKRKKYIREKNINPKIKRMYYQVIPPEKQKSILTSDEYREYVVNPLMNNLNKLIRCFEIYLCEYVQTLPIEYKSPDIAELNIDKVLSFNYTNTYQRVYDDGSRKIEYDFIHGEANSKRKMRDNDMVLGIKPMANLEFNDFTKSYQRKKKKTSCIYKKWIEEMESMSVGANSLQAKNNVYIFGHSLDMLDADIIESLINVPGVRTTIYYYDKESHERLKANVTRMIGEDEAKKRIESSDPTIIFKPQSKK